MAARRELFSFFFGKSPIGRGDLREQRVAVLSSQKLCGLETFFKYPVIVPEINLKYIYLRKEIKRSHKKHREEIV